MWRRFMSTGKGLILGSFRTGGTRSGTRGGISGLFRSSRILRAAPGAGSASCAGTKITSRVLRPWAPCAATVACWNILRTRRFGAVAAFRFRVSCPMPLGAGRSRCVRSPGAIAARSRLGFTSCAWIGRSWRRASVRAGCLPTGSRRVLAGRCSRRRREPWRVERLRPSRRGCSR